MIDNPAIETRITNLGLTAEKILDRLRRVKGPDLKNDIVTLGLVSDLVINDDKVYFSISVEPGRAGDLECMRLAAQQCVERLEGVRSARVVLTSHSGQAGANPSFRESAQPAEAGKPPYISEIIAVVAGKGGVGKSTTAVNLALAMHETGLKVGLLDADIHGPSVPRILGVSAKPQAIDSKRFSPLKAHGIKVISMGLLVDENMPVIWRGPMVSSALMRLLYDVAWGELDILVLDMPPGTGDIPLTIVRKVLLSGIVVVSTPQDLSLSDVRRTINMFRRFDVPILGLVENMSYFSCPCCQTHVEIFGHGGVRKEAEKQGLAFLGEIPLLPIIRELSDVGMPIVSALSDEIQARSYRVIAKSVVDHLARSRSGEKASCAVD